MTPHEHHHQNGHTANDAANPRDELAWTAFLYSTGELPESEAAQFEDRLEADPTAQAALAQAVALSAGVKLSEASVVAPPATLSVRRDDFAGRRIAGWMLLATAASVALWFGVSQPRVEPGRDAAHSPVGQAQQELAVAWAAGQPTEDDLVIVDETMPEDELLAEIDSHPVIEEPSAPDWLIAALVDAETSPVRQEN